MSGWVRVGNRGRHWAVRRFTQIKWGAPEKALSSRRSSSCQLAPCDMLTLIARLQPRSQAGPRASGCGLSQSRGESKGEIAKETGGAPHASKSAVDNATTIRARITDGDGDLAVLSRAGASRDRRERRGATCRIAGYAPGVERGHPSLPRPRVSSGSILNNLGTNRGAAARGWQRPPQDTKSASRAPTTRR